MPDFDAAYQNIDKFAWNVLVAEEENRWAVYAGKGETLIFSSSDKGAVDAFIYGMGLAYSIFPDEFVEKFMKHVGLDNIDD
jgi:hypothetical protein